MIKKTLWGILLVSVPLLIGAIVYQKTFTVLSLLMTLTSCSGILKNRNDIPTTLFWGIQALILAGASTILYFSLLSGDTLQLVISVLVVILIVTSCVLHYIQQKRSN